ncbi:hypothetical protein [Rhizobium sp. BK176]|uniref:hypothetical protein n=1 Tax=Rhizobium sp. BK176 TaxID=2587071 RepID=UPI002169449F|nr:hypothetical protein [Rhizobium sp. BK176]MCS4089967.1 hypothetical protein [Rhizobium sp. BK176]
MKLDIRYPMMFKSTIKGDRSSRATKFVDVHHVVRAEILEVSVQETGVALGTITEGASHERPAGATLPPIRSYGGKFYRKLELAPDMFNKCYIGELNKSRGHIAIGDGAKGDSSNGWHPGGYNIRSRNAWLAQVLGIVTKRNDRIWPVIHWHDAIHVPGSTRDFITLDRVRPQLKDIDADSFAYATSMMDMETDRLLRIGREVWMETTMPCVTVKPEGLNIEFLPRGVDTRLDIKRFPLSKFDDAVDYMGGIRGQMVEMPVVDTGGEDVTPFDFDEEDEELYRLCFAVASAVARRSEQQDFHPIYEGKGALFDGHDRETFDAIRDELLASNDILGHRGSLQSMLPEIADLWRKCDYPLYNPLLTVKTKRVEAMIERCLDAMPINIQTAPISTPSMRR